MAKLSDIKLKDMLKLPKAFWQKEAVKIRAWIKEDSIAGETQGYSGSGARSYSSQYAKYKNNNMRRFTDGKRLGTPRTTKDGNQTNPKNNALTGTQLNNWTGSVNMNLTGATINGLKFLSLLPNNEGMIMTYNPKDEKKLAGNELRGRYMRTLNDKNQNKTLTDITKAIEKNIKTKLPKEIVINLQVGL